VKFGSLDGYVLTEGQKNISMLSGIYQLQCCVLDYVEFGTFYLGAYNWINVQNVGGPLNHFVHCYQKSE
jgi:hypothetical protein